MNPITIAVLIVISLVISQGVGAVAGVKAPDTCGTTGPINERIQNCKNAFKDLAIRRDPVDPFDRVWELVARMSSGVEVWRDKHTNFLWTKQLPIDRKYIYVVDNNVWADNVRSGRMRPWTMFKLDALNEREECTDTSKNRHYKANLEVAFDLPSSDEAKQAFSHGFFRVFPEIRHVFLKTMNMGAQTFAWYDEYGEYQEDRMDTHFWADGRFIERYRPSRRHGLSEYLPASVVCVASGLDV